MTVSVPYVSVTLSTRATGGHFPGFADFVLDCADAGAAASSVNEATNTRAASTNVGNTRAGNANLGDVGAAGRMWFMVSPFVGDLRCAENSITKDFECVELIRSLNRGER